jgi:hypothetical protein
VLTANKHAAQGSQSRPSEPEQTVPKAGHENASSAPVPSAQPQADERASAAAVNKEFGWER